MKFPHCQAKLILHEGSKVGFAHCNGCGCCFDMTDMTVRRGHGDCIKTGPIAKAPNRGKAAKADELAPEMGASEPTPEPTPEPTAEPEPAPEPEADGAVEGDNAAAEPQS